MKQPARQQAHALTVDVEDYFQVQAFAEAIPRASWDTIPRRVEANVQWLLQLLAEYRTTATFFTLGWIAQRHPGMVRDISAAGHELASHGYDHVRADELSPAQFREDVHRSKAAIEDIVGNPVVGYRAPTFSIGPRNQWVYPILAEEGYRYSSSIYPIRHDLYGDIGAPRIPFRPGEACLWEIPLTTRRLLGQNLPCAGGGYFRLIPYPLWRRNLTILSIKEQAPCIFYFHPWELDPAQPRIAGINMRTRLRHYTNLKHMRSRLTYLLRDFAWDRMDRVFAELIGEPIPTQDTHPSPFHRIA